MTMRNAFSFPSSHFASTSPQIVHVASPDDPLTVADSATWYDAPQTSQVMSAILMGWLRRPAVRRFFDLPEIELGHIRRNQTPGVKYGKYAGNEGRRWNTGFFRNPQCLWKTLSWFSPGQDFMTNKFLPAGGHREVAPFDFHGAMSANGSGLNGMSALPSGADIVCHTGHVR
jgi:hypothetical protein